MLRDRHRSRFNDTPLIMVSLMIDSKLRSSLDVRSHDQNTSPFCNLSRTCQTVGHSFMNQKVCLSFYPHLLGVSNSESIVFSHNVCIDFASPVTRL